MTIVLVTNPSSRRRLADRTALVNDSRLVEVDETETTFTPPANRLTERYVNGISDDRQRAGGGHAKHLDLF